MTKITTILAVLIVQLIPVCHANILTNADFNTPDNEWWANSGWMEWGDCFRSNYADRAGSGRGVVAQGWKEPQTVGFYQDVSVTLGLTYTFSIWVKKDASYTESNTELKIEWIDASRSNNVGLVITNITGQAGPTYTKFKISGSTANVNCKYVRVVVSTAWSNAVAQASMQFDDAYLETEPGTVIQISENHPKSFLPALLFVPLAGLCLCKRRKDAKSELN